MAGIARAISLLRCLFTPDYHGFHILDRETHKSDKHGQVQAAQTERNLDKQH